MCEYCRPDIQTGDDKGKDIICKKIDMGLMGKLDMYLNIEKLEKRMELFMANENGDSDMTINVDIKYCPMCGEHL